MYYPFSSSRISIAVATPLNNVIGTIVFNTTSQYGPNAWIIHAHDVIGVTRPSAPRLPGAMCRPRARLA